MFVPLGIADVLFMRLLRVPWDMRWPVLHATANMVITAVSAPDAWRALSDPRAACGGEFTRAPLYMVFAVSATRPQSRLRVAGRACGHAFPKHSTVNNPLVWSAQLHVYHLALFSAITKDDWCAKSTPGPA